MNLEPLQQAEQRLFHAINLEDFLAYWQQQGVLSRARLQSCCPNFTRFFSDEKDKELNVWNRSFGNLNDFGRYFWSYESATPNAYGPITLVFSKDVWEVLQDIRITKNTITADEPEAIPSESWHEMYESDKGTLRLKSGYTACEVSVANEIIPFDYLAYVLVDPIKIGNNSLRNHLWSSIEKIENVCESSFQLTEKRLIERQTYCEPQTKRMSELIAWSQNLKGKLIEENEPLEQSLPQSLTDWFNSLENWKKRILASWLTYTYNGTIRLMEDEFNNTIDSPS